MNPTIPPSVAILGVPIHPVTYESWLDLVADFVASGAPHQICTANPEFVMTAQRDPQFMAVLQNADLVLPDGAGLLWAAKRQGQALPERVTGSDGIYQLAERAAQVGWRLYLLGAGPGVAERTAEILQQRYPGLNIAGTFAGSPSEADYPEIAARIKAAAPDILLVAYGAPKQDLWIAEHMQDLQTPVGIGIGGAFDHVTGVRRRAPNWLIRLNLEWLWRLVTQPWRWRRQLQLPKFVWRVLHDQQLTTDRTSD
ncbi:MAG TPA: WecB/TagA/CpsF family glycosyltransferase [Caldilineae bacterium]|nr:WecB/TagA/CpsF family glycosyltransferase [Caldilineae bacterium]